MNSPTNFPACIGFVPGGNLLSGFKKALMQNPRDMIRGRILQGNDSGFGPKVGVTGQKWELQWGRPPESEPNRPEKEPESALGASAKNPP